MVSRTKMMLLNAVFQISIEQSIKFYFYILITYSKLILTSDFSIGLFDIWLLLCWWLPAGYASWNWTTPFFLLMLQLVTLLSCQCKRHHQTGLCKQRNTAADTMAAEEGDSSSSSPLMDHDTYIFSSKKTALCNAWKMPRGLLHTCFFFLEDFFRSRYPGSMPSGMHLWGGQSGLR